MCRGFTSLFVHGLWNNAVYLMKLISIELVEVVYLLLENCSVKIQYRWSRVSRTYFLFYYMQTYIHAYVCVCARTPYVVIGNVKFSTSNTKCPKTGYYLQAVPLTPLPIIANHTEQTDCIITHIGAMKLSRQQKLYTIDMRHFRLPPPSRRELSSSG
jgi:hypothetical protein